jgi:hypothetical protein
MRNWDGPVGSRTRASLIACGLTVALLAAPVAAQPRPPRPDDVLPPGSGDMTPGQLQQLFDAMLMMQAQQALSLNETQYGQFVPRLRALQNTRRRYQMERARVINELQQATNPRAARPAANEAMVKERLAALQELESRHAADVRKAYSGLDEVLDVYQQARFRVFEEQMERRKLELIGRARQNLRNQRRPPPGR